MTRSTQLIAGSALTAVAIVLLWFRAPIVPALTGAFAASWLLFRTNRGLLASQRRPSQQRR